MHKVIFRGTLSEGMVDDWQLEVICQTDANIVTVQEISVWFVSSF